MTETPGAPAFDDWPANEQRKRERIARGMVAARLELAARHVAPPTDEKHADAYDPPLSLAETRHGIHVAQGLDCSAFCRFGVSS